MDRILDYVAATVACEKGYSSLFKAGFVLLAAAMFALAQTGTFLYNRDIQAYQSKYSVEAAAGEPLNVIHDCTTLAPDLASGCKLAKHELYTLTSSLKLFYTIYEVCFWLGVVLIVLSAIGYIATPFMKEKSVQVMKLNVLIVCESKGIRIKERGSASLIAHG